MEIHHCEVGLRHTNILPLVYGCIPILVEVGRHLKSYCCIPRMCNLAGETPLPLPAPPVKLLSPVA